MAIQQAEALVTRPQGLAIIQNDYLPEVNPAAVEQAMMIGDLSQMTPEIRIAYYVAVCKSVGLNALSRPFQALKTDDGSIVLYPDKGCAEQLRKRDRISLRIVSREYVDDLYVVTVEASTPDGRTEESEGIVVVMETAGEWKEGTKRDGSKYRFKEEKFGADGQPILKRLTGTQMANARMRCETKAKRRATLAICGLGMPDGGEGHPMRFDPGQGTLEDDEADPEAEVVDVTPLRDAERTKSKDDHIEDLTGHRPETASRHAGADYVPQIEAVIAAQQGDPAVFWPWAEKQKKKPQAEFSAADYTDLLARAKSQAKKRQEAAQEIVSSDAPPDEYVNVDPETGEVLDHDNAELDREIAAQERQPGEEG